MTMPDITTGAEQPADWTEPPEAEHPADQLQPVTINGLTFLPIDASAHDGRAYIVVDPREGTMQSAQWFDGTWIFQRRLAGGQAQPLAVKPTHYHPRHDKPQPKEA